MDDDSVNATTIIGASVEVVFAILADPTTHAAIDGTGWVNESIDDRPLTAAGQIFRMAMYHPNHPDGNYEIANQVVVFEPPTAIAWKPGYDAGDGSLAFGGWIWRYDLTPAGPSETTVVLTYDWSAVSEEIRTHIGFPPFPPDHLGNSLAHLTHLATSRSDAPASGRRHGGDTPIDTFFPIPAVDDDADHVYVSVGHGQMMTDPMKPLGLSVFQLTAARPMHEAGGRLFVDVSAALAAPATRAGLLEVFGRGDPLIGDALRTLVDRGDVVAPLPDGAPAPAAATPPPANEPDPALVPQLIARTEGSLAALHRDIRQHTGPELLEFILADIEELKRMLFRPESHQAVMAGMDALWWLNDHLQEWLGEKGAADALTRSAPHDVTATMGLELLDVADAIRPHPEVVAFLRQVRPDDAFLDDLDDLAGGRDARDAIAAWLDRYGMRCIGEIDITRPRWRERPGAVVPVILGNVDNFEPGERTRRHERGLQQARTTERNLLARLRARPDGARNAADTKRMIDRLRAFIGYREHPKYGMISRYFEYKQALLDEAGRLVQEGVLRAADDIFWLTFDELSDVVRNHRVDDELIRGRQAAFRAYETLTPPRVFTSAGEVITGSYHRDDAPAGALIGLAVSAGSVEGRARVIVDLSDADLEPGDILVTTQTDPSWTPLLAVVSGLVTEVGGLMTHGAVVAREYGLPAVVGVADATDLIRDGQRIRVDGTEGYVEILRANTATG